MRASFASRAAARVRARSSVEDGIASKVECLLEALGADPAFADAVLGDLTEEHARRAARDGARTARWWYVGEALRSAPHLLASAVRHASWRRRARLSAYIAAVLLAPAVAVIALFGGNGLPAQLVADMGSAADIVVNNVRPVQLAMRVLDAAGHVLPDTGVRYRWSAGVPVPVSSTGVVTCTQPGDATVHASLGPLTTRLTLRCRPVLDVRAFRMLNIVVGGPVAEVPFLAVDADGQRVTQLRGQITVEDSSVATVNVTAEGKQLLRARAAGSTALNVRIGDRDAHMEVHVYERASTPEGIRPGQHLAVPVQVRGGDMRQWRLAASPELY
ncbi:MAG: hypothetical protein LH467_11995 [Gemmatimonadaceae bacterium]|nr:hypothetical protein [Gemmatimonadaceae bacterium]